MKRIYSFSCLIISLLILILTIYKSELREEGLMREYYLIYYIISITLLFYSILIIFVNKETFINLSVLLLSLFSILYFFEGYLVFNKFYTENEVNKKKILKFDKRTRYQVYIDLKKKDKNITISLTPGLLKFKEKQIFHLSGISNSKTIDCNESGYYSIYESDRYGFNNPDKEWDQNEVEYLLVGDSFIQGNCVNRPNDISSVLRKLSNKPVVNIAYKAMGPLLEYSSLREYSNIKVKKILWFYYEGNDLHNLSEELTNEILVKYLRESNFSQDLKRKQKIINNLLIKNTTHEEQKYKFKSIFFNFLKFTQLRNFLLKEPSKNGIDIENSNVILKFGQIMKLTKELAISKNSQLFFIYLPEYKRFNSTYSNKNYYLIRRIVENLGIPFIDINKEVFEKEKNPLSLFPFEIENHYNISGYRRISEAVYNFTKNKD
tara:strand:+ start:94 stop:1395 length:1302 start_codon:yes stop_codon:yes gene_type:complete